MKLGLCSHGGSTAFSTTDREVEGVVIPYDHARDP
jgi:hypothetical protein